MIITFAAAAAILVLVNLLSIIIAGWRMAPSGKPAPSVRQRPPVSIVVPARGIEAFTTETLARAFSLDWPGYELIFCVASPRDPVVAAIRRAMAAHPGIPTRILTGDDRISANPKLNNCVKGWKAARHDWVILADSNVLMPKDYVAHLMAGWHRNTGLVCSTPIGARPDGFWAEVECMFLNTQQARWQYAGEALGFGFAQGKSMLWFKPLLDDNGGIEALAAEIAEDAAATKLVNRLGYKVHLVSSPFDQPLGRRSRHDVWSRQARWARLRRVTFPLFFTPEILLGALPPLLLAVTAALLAGVNAPATAFAVTAAIYLPELALGLAKGWRVSLLSLPAILVRDVMLPLVWIRSWGNGAFVWRGNAMTIDKNACELEEVVQ
ncbi:ceramide glucosyltransferase [Pararhizobium polonicum]|uniref:Ceramide glucosyltransferase n=1 Tax=Pararhizobium polonicum TaxID=1612624 RepID=A0A1C7NXQ9_9HYPH|nr:glycosyltransferase [Pararhizobium polonicum]OBZ93782.1 ceramide glucosyltransferase [Pararhizobium polonicum]